MSIVDLIRAGNMSARLAGLFWIGLERGASLIVAANPPSSGKTTTLSALLSFTPPQTLVYFTRGVGETFDLPPASPEYPTYLLINEMSDHIPVYTWDDNARQAFNLLEQGYRLATTMHDDTVEGVIGQLEGELHIPREQIGNVTFIVPLHIGRRQGIIRRVREVAFLQRNGAGFGMETIASWRPDTDGFEMLASPAQREAFAAWAGLSPAVLDEELGRREGYLNTLDKTAVHSVPEVNAAIESYHRQSVRG